MSTSPLRKPPLPPNRQRQHKGQSNQNRKQNQPSTLRLRRLSLFLVVFLVSFAVLSAVEGLMGTAGGRNTAIAAPPPALTWTAPVIIGPTQPDTQPFWQIAIRVRPTDGMGFIIGEGAGGTTLQPQNRGLTFLQKTSNLSAALTNINDAERNTQQFPSFAFASDGSAFVTYRHLPEGAGWRGYMRYMAANEVWQPGVDIGAARNWGVGATSAELYTTGNAYSAVENKAFVTGELFDTNTSARHWGFAVLTSAATGIVPGTERIVAANKPSGGITSVPVMCVSPTTGDIHIAGQWGPDVAAISRIGGVWQAAPTSLTPSKPADWAVRKDVNIACAPDGYVYVVWPSDDKTFGIGRFNPTSKVWEPLYFDALAPLAPGLPSLATRYANVLVTNADPSRVWVAFNTNGGGFGTGSGTFLVSSGDRGQTWSVGATDVQQVFSTPAGTLNIGNGIAYVPQTGRIMLAHTIQLPDGSRRSEFTMTNESIVPPPPPTATATAIPPTATTTATARPPTVTATAIPPSMTATATVAQPSATATVAQPSPTSTATATATSTSTSTATATATSQAATATAAATATLAPTATATATTSSGGGGGGGGTSNVQATATALAYIRGQLTADARNAYGTITANAARNTTAAPPPAPTASPTAQAIAVQPTVQVQPATARPSNPPVAAITATPRPATATPRPPNPSPTGTGTGTGMGVVATSQPLPMPQASPNPSPTTGTSVSVSASASASVSATPRALPAFDLSGNSSVGSGSTGAVPGASVVAAQPLPAFGLLAPTPTPLPPTPTPTPTIEPLPTVTPADPATAEPQPTATEVAILPADTGLAPGEGLAIAGAVPVPGAGAGQQAISSSSYSYAATTSPIASINAVEGGFSLGLSLKVMLSLGIAGLALFIVVSGVGNRFLLLTRHLRLHRSKGGS